MWLSVLGHQVRCAALRYALVLWVPHAIQALELRALCEALECVFRSAKAAHQLVQQVAMPTTVAGRCYCCSALCMVQSPGRLQLSLTTFAAMRAVSSRQNPLEAHLVQTRGVGTYSEPLLPQLGHLHPSYLDAHLL